MRNQDREVAARVAAHYIRLSCGCLDNNDLAKIGLILGTGWGDVLEIENSGIM